MRKSSERGAVIVEATLSLTTFIFAIFTLLSIVNICYIQARINTALNSAAKEISQYTYFYYKFGLDKLQGIWSEGLDDESALAKDTINGVGTLVDSLSDAKSSIDTGDFEGLQSAINSGYTNTESLVTQYADRLADDPKGLIVGMGQMLLNEGIDDLKSKIMCEVLGKAFIKKNLKASPTDDPDNFLKRYKVVDGMAGLDFEYSVFLKDGTSNLIQLVVTYDVRVLQLLNIDFDFTFRHCVKTTAWGRGISKIEPSDSTPTPDVAEAEEQAKSTIWDEPSGERGKYITAQEKKKYEYTDTGHHYDAYDPDNHEFITIVSVDTNAKSYESANAIKNRLNNMYENMEMGTSKLKDPFTVTDENGKQVEMTKPSEEDTNYTVVLVVPDNADMAVVNEAIRLFHESYPDVKVEVRTGYGSPTPEETVKNPDPQTPAENDQGN